MAMSAEHRLNIFSPSSAMVHDVSVWVKNSRVGRSNEQTNIPSTLTACDLSKITFAEFELIEIKGSITNEIQF